MKDYIAIWKRRRLELILVNILFLIISILIIVYDGEWLTAFITWFFGAWILCAMAAVSSKNENSGGGVARDFATGILSGFGAAFTGGGIFFVFIYLIYMVKAMYALCVLTVLFVIEFIGYPFTTIYYYIRYRNEKKITIL